MDVETYLEKMREALDNLEQAVLRTEAVAKCLRRSAVAKYSPPDLPNIYKYEKELKEKGGLK